MVGGFVLSIIAIVVGAWGLRKHLEFRRRERAPREHEPQQPIPDIRLAEAQNAWVRSLWMPAFGLLVSGIIDNVHWEVRTTSRGDGPRADLVRERDGMLAVAEVKRWSPSARPAALRQRNDYIMGLRGQGFTAGADDYTGLVALFESKNGALGPMVVWVDQDDKGLIWFAPFAELARSKDTDLQAIALQAAAQGLVERDARAAPWVTLGELATPSGIETLVKGGGMSGLRAVGILRRAAHDAVLSG